MGVVEKLAERYCWYWTTGRRALWVMRKPAANGPSEKAVSPATTDEDAARALIQKSASVGASLLAMARAVEFIPRAMVQSKKVARADFDLKGYSGEYLRNRWLRGKTEAKSPAGSYLQ